MPYKKKPIPNLKCPHCNSDLPNVEFRMFGDGRVWLVGCPHCLKVIGGNYETKRPFATLKAQQTEP